MKKNLRGRKTQEEPEHNSCVTWSEILYKILYITCLYLLFKSIPNQEGDIYDLISSSDISLVNQALLIFHLHFPNSILTFDPVLSHKIKPASS